MSETPQGKVYNYVVERLYQPLKEKYPLKKLPPPSKKKLCTSFKNKIVSAHLIGYHDKTNFRSWAFIKLGILYIPWSNGRFNR